MGPVESAEIPLVWAEAEVSMIYLGGASFRD
jgi:hypothetical protein